MNMNEIFSIAILVSCQANVVPWSRQLNARSSYGANNGLDKKEAESVESAYVSRAGLGQGVYVGKIGNLGENDNTLNTGGLRHPASKYIAKSPLSNTDKYENIKTTTRPYKNDVMYKGRPGFNKFHDKRLQRAPSYAQNTQIDKKSGYGPTTTVARSHKEVNPERLVYLSRTSLDGGSASYDPEPHVYRANNNDQGTNIVNAGSLDAKAPTIREGNEQKDYDNKIDSSNQYVNNRKPKKHYRSTEIGNFGNNVPETNNAIEDQMNQEYSVGKKENDNGDYSSKSDDYDVESLGKHDNSYTVPEIKHNLSGSLDGDNFHGNLPKEAFEDFAYNFGAPDFESFNNKDIPNTIVNDHAMVPTFNDSNNIDIYNESLPNQKAIANRISEDSYEHASMEHRIYDGIDSDPTSDDSLEIMLLSGNGDFSNNNGGFSNNNGGFGDNIGSFSNNNGGFSNNNGGLSDNVGGFSDNTGDVSDNIGGFSNNNGGCCCGGDSNSDNSNYNHINQISRDQIAHRSSHQSTHHVTHQFNSHHCGNCLQSQSNNYNNHCNCGCHCGCNCGCNCGCCGCNCGQSNTKINSQVIQSNQKFENICKLCQMIHNTQINKGQIHQSVHESNHINSNYENIVNQHIHKNHKNQNNQNSQVHISIESSTNKNYKYENLVTQRYENIHKHESHIHSKQEKNIIHSKQESNIVHNQQENNIIHSNNENSVTHNNQESNSNNHVCECAKSSHKCECETASNHKCECSKTIISSHKCECSKSSSSSSTDTCNCYKPKTICNCYEDTGEKIMNDWNNKKESSSITFGNGGNSHFQSIVNSGAWGGLFGHGKHKLNHGASSAVSSAGIFGNGGLSNGLFGNQFGLGHGHHGIFGIG